MMIVNVAEVAYETNWVWNEFFFQWYSRIPRASTKETK